MLLVARIFGEVAQRLGQPALVGELIAGVLLGPSILNIVQPTSDLSTTINIALFFIMFLTGINFRRSDIAGSGRSALIISILAFVIPYFLGFDISALFGFNLLQSMVVALVIATTAVPVNAIILMEFGLLKTKLGATIITAGVINDILSLMVLGIIMQLGTNATVITSSELAVSVVKVLLFVGGVFALSEMLSLKRTWLRSKMPTVSAMFRSREAVFGALLIFAIGLSLLAEQAGLHFIIGTFFAGLLLNEAIGDETMKKTAGITSAITFGFFAPLLFAFIGLEFNSEAVLGVLVFAGILLITAVLSKFAGGFLGAFLTGFSVADSRAIGLLMNARGMVELVIATIAYEAGLIDTAIFSVVVAIGVITTIISASATKIAVRDTAKSAAVV